MSAELIAASSGQSSDPVTRFGTPNEWTLSAEELQLRRATALADAEEQIAFFRRSAKTAHRLLHRSQVVIIVLSALTPVILLTDAQVVIIVLSAITPVILLTDAAVLPFLADDGRRRLIAAILSALVAIVAGLSNAFRWGEE